MTGSDASAKDTAQQISEIHDRMAIQQLAIHYAHAVRAKDADLVLSLFADPAATLDFDKSVDMFGERKLSYGEMRKIYADGMDLLDPWPIMSNHLIDLESPTRATGTVCIELRHGKKKYQVAWIGTYQDVYEKIDGQWKFRSRRAAIIHVPMIEG